MLHPRPLLPLLVPLLLLASPPGARAQAHTPPRALAPAAPHTPASLPFAGPLRVGEQNPLYRLFYVPLGQAADLVAPGETEVEVLVSYASIFERSHGARHVQLFDMERMTTQVAVRWGVSERVEAGLTLPFQTNWEGFLDPLIQGYHAALSLPNGDRETVEDGSFGAWLWDLESGNRLSIRRSVLAVEDLRVYAKVRLAGGERGALAVRGVAKLPTGAEGTGTGRADGALELLGRVSAGAWHVHALAGAGTLRAPPALDPFVSDAAAFFVVGVEREIAAGVSAVAQVVTSSRYVGGFGVTQLDRVPAVLALGAAGRLGGGWRWEASFSEDVPPDGPSVDFVVDVGVSRRW